MIPDSLENKTFLVAGAAGFVPSTLSEFLLKKGAKVIGLDNFITGSKSNVELLNKYDNFEFHECNIYESLPDFSGVDIDYIFSLASPASPIDFKIIPIEIMRVNSEGTLALLELAKEKLGDKYVLQGNMEPTRLYSKDAIKEGIEKIVKTMDNSRHIFNLGHGILPDVPVENAKYFIKEVQKQTKR